MTIHHIYLCLFKVYIPHIGVQKVISIQSKAVSNNFSRDQPHINRVLPLMKYAKNLLSNFSIFTCRKDVVYDGKDFFTLLYINLMENIKRKSRSFFRKIYVNHKHISLFTVLFELIKGENLLEESVFLDGIKAENINVFDREQNKSDIRCQ